MTIPRRRVARLRYVNGVSLTKGAVGLLWTVKRELEAVAASDDGVTIVAEDDAAFVDCFEAKLAAALEALDAVDPERGARVADLPLRIPFAAAPASRRAIPRRVTRAARIGRNAAATRGHRRWDLLQVGFFGDDRTFADWAHPLLARPEVVAGTAGLVARPAGARRVLAAVFPATYQFDTALRDARAAASTHEGRFGRFSRRRIARRRSLSQKESPNAHHRVGTRRADATRRASRS